MSTSYEEIIQETENQLPEPETVGVGLSKASRAKRQPPMLSSKTWAPSFPSSHEPHGFTFILGVPGCKLSTSVPSVGSKRLPEATFCHL